MFEEWVRTGLGWGIELTVAGFTVVFITGAVIGLLAAIASIGRGEDHDRTL